jgi:hypothetical protein
MAQIQHIDVFAGEDRTISLYARDSANLPTNLTSKTLTTYVGRPPLRPDCSDALFTKSGSIVSASAGTYTIAIADTDTQYMSGDYEYQTKTVDGSGNIAVVTLGRFRVRPVMV